MASSIAKWSAVFNLCDIDFLGNYAVSGSTFRQKVRLLRTHCTIIGTLYTYNTVGQSMVSVYDLNW